MPCSYNCQTGSTVSKVLVAVCLTLLVAFSFSSIADAQQTDTSNVQPARPIHIVPMVNSKGQPLPM